LIVLLIIFALRAVSDRLNKLSILFYLLRA